MMATETKISESLRAAIRLVHAALQAGVVELRGEHCSGGAPRASAGERWPDPAEMDVGTPTVREIEDAAGSCAGDDDLETAMMAAAHPESAEYRDAEDFVAEFPGTEEARDVLAALRRIDGEAMLNHA